MTKLMETSPAGLVTQTVDQCRTRAIRTARPRPVDDRLLPALVTYTPLPYLQHQQNVILLFILTWINLYHICSFKGLHANKCLHLILEK